MIIGDTLQKLGCKEIVDELESSLLTKGKNIDIYQVIKKDTNK